MPQLAEIRETQFENLVDGQLGEAGGTDGVAGGEHVDEMAVQLCKGTSPNPVRVAWDGLRTVVPVVVVRLVPKLAGFSRPNRTCRRVPSRRSALTGACRVRHR